MTIWTGCACVLLVAGGGLQAAPIDRCRAVAEKIVPTTISACLRKESLARAHGIGSADAIARSAVAACYGRIVASAHRSGSGSPSTDGEARRFAFYKVVQARAGRCPD